MHRRPFPYLILLAFGMVLMFIYFHHKLQETAAKSDRLSRKCLTSTINETDVVAIVQDMYEIKEHRQLLLEQRQENEEVKEKFEVVAQNLDSLNREATKDVQRTTQQVDQVVRQTQQQRSATEEVAKNVAILQSQVTKLKQSMNAQNNKHNQIVNSLARLAKPTPVSTPPVGLGSTPVDLPTVALPTIDLPTVDVLPIVGSTAVQKPVVLGNWEALDQSAHSTPLTPPASPPADSTSDPIQVPLTDSINAPPDTRQDISAGDLREPPIQTVSSESEDPTEQLEGEKLPSFDFAQDVAKSSK